MTKKLKYIPFLIFPVIIIGCGSDVNPEFTPFTASAMHPFASVMEHPNYLYSNGYHLEECTPCHGPNLDWYSGESQRSCNSSNCHNQANGGPIACNSCHGNFYASSDTIYNNAPPENLIGDTATTVLTVGAHQSIVRPGGNFAPIACLNCHKIPSAWSSSGHINGVAPYQAEVIFDFIAVEEDANPVWNRSQATCSNTYCHFEAEPVWTQVDGTWSACGSCHLIPPEDDHPSWPSINECRYCHDQTIDENGDIINPSLHCNGEVDD